MTRPPSYSPIFGDGESGNSADCAEVAKPDQRLGRRQRLTRSSEVRDAFAQGRSFAGRFMVMWLRRGPNANLRLAVVSSRSIGGAVARNRARRRLREVFRRNRYRLHGAVDVVLVARRALLGARWQELIDDLMELAGRAGLLCRVENPALREKQNERSKLGGKNENSAIGGENDR